MPETTNPFTTQIMVNKIVPENLTVGAAYAVKSKFHDCHTLLLNVTEDELSLTTTPSPDARDARMLVITANQLAEGEYVLRPLS